MKRMRNPVDVPSDGINTELTPTKKAIGLKSFSIGKRACVEDMNRTLPTTKNISLIASLSLHGAPMGLSP